MAAIAFPTNPSYGDTHQSLSVTYIWDGSTWVGYTTSAVRQADLSTYSTLDQATAVATQRAIALG